MPTKTRTMTGEEKRRFYIVFVGGACRVGDVTLTRTPGTTSYADGPHRYL